MSDSTITFGDVDRAYQTYRDTMAEIGFVVMLHNGMPPYSISGDIQNAHAARAEWYRLSDAWNARSNAPTN